MKISRYTSKGSRGIILSMTEDEYSYLVEDTEVGRLVLHRDGLTFWVTRAHDNLPDHGYSVETTPIDRQGYTRKIVFGREITEDLEPKEIGRTVIPTETTTFDSAGVILPAFRFSWTDIQPRPVLERSNRGISHEQRRLDKIARNQEKHKVMSRDKPEMVPELGPQAPEKPKKRTIKDVKPPKDKIAAAAFSVPALAHANKLGIVEASEDRRYLRLALDSINDMIRRGEAKANINEAGEIEVQVIRIEQL